MDRRIRKTKEAIFSAFTELLSHKSFSQITVGEIIDAADVGRATFYAHFETKDFLLKELCEELFCHVIDSTKVDAPAHKHIFDCDAPDSIFLHLFNHLQKNDNNILLLLSGENNELFMHYFKSNLKTLIISQYANKGLLNNPALPTDYLVNHVSSSFVETVSWWINNKMQQSPEQITEYFLSVIEPIIK